MALIKSAVKLIIREHAEYRFAGPVLELGVPEIYATEDELRTWFPTLAEQQCDIDPSEVTLSTNAEAQRLKWVTSKTFLKAFGISDITSMDIPGCEHPPDLVHNLNEPLPSDLIGRFNLIVDPGTIEHVFDVKTSLTNIVRALRVGGVVIHQVPVYNYNAGYFNINPNVMHDFYRSNGFDGIKAYIIMWDQYRAFTGKNRCYLYSEQLLGGRNALSDYDLRRFAPFLLFLARKAREPAGIVSPIQFQTASSQQYALDDARPTSLKKRLSQVLIAMMYRRFPLPLAYYVESFLWRKWSLHKTHRRSFWI